MSGSGILIEVKLLLWWLKPWNWLENNNYYVMVSVPKTYAKTNINHDIAPLWGYKQYAPMGLIKFL